MRFSSCLLLALACGPCLAQSYDGPIIDVHLHVGRAAPGAPNPATGVPTTANTDAEREAMTLERMRRHGIVLGLVSGPDEAMASMRRAGGDRIRAGAFMDDGRTRLPPPEVLREAFERGDLQVIGEVGAQYHGMDPGEDWFEPYMALAEEFDVPVGIHTGLAPPGAAYGCCPDFRIELGNPLRLEPMLKKHPNVRVWLMHAGWPFLAETKALLYMYPQVHADVSVINWIIPRAEFHDYLEALVRAGLTDRLMFGSDQMVWPEAITQAIEGVDSAPFLSAVDKRAIFHDNAARFLRIADAPVTGPEEAQP